MEIPSNISRYGPGYWISTQNLSPNETVDGWFFYGIRTRSDQAGVAKFHTHWFLQGFVACLFPHFPTKTADMTVRSLLTQTLIVHLLRTAKIPLFRYWAAPVLIATTIIISV